MMRASSGICSPFQTAGVAVAVPPLVVVQDGERDRLEARDARHQAVADARVQLHHGALLGGQAAGLEQDPLGDPDLAEVVQQRAEDQLLAAALVDPESFGDRADVRGDLLGVPTDEGVLRGDRVRQHRDGAEVAGAQLPPELVVVQHGAGVVAERQQHVLLELFEAALAVGADDDAAELVAQVDRDRHEVVDLLVGVGAPLAVERARIVLAHRLVLGEHALGVLVGDHGVAGVVLEALGARQRQGVATVVGAGEQQPLLGVEGVDRDLQDEQGGVLGAAERAALVVQGHDLGAQLLRPGALGASGALDERLRALLGLQTLPALALGLLERLLGGLAVAIGLAADGTQARMLALPGDQHRRGSEQHDAEDGEGAAPQVAEGRADEERGDQPERRRREQSGGDEKERPVSRPGRRRRARHGSEDTA